MNPPTHLPTKFQGEVITPDQVVSLILGTDTITLSGFGGVPVRAPFWVPVVARFDQAQVSQAYRRSMKAVRWISGCGLAVVVVALGAVLFWAGSLSSPAAGATSAPGAVAWAPKAVVTTGVIISVGRQDVTVPLGSILPNGEVLRATDIRRQTFTTDSQITAVKR